MLAHSHGQPWNANALASSFAVSPHTATHYRSILEQMFLVRAIHSGVGRYPLSPGTDAVGLDEFLAEILPRL